MRYVLIILLVGLISCSHKKKKEFIQKEIIFEKQDTTNQVTVENSDSSAFADHSESYIRVYNQNSNIQTEINNVNYSENFLNYQNELNYFIVKKSQILKTKGGFERQESSITVEIFNIHDSKKISTIKTTADDISIYEDYYRTVKYGCCGSGNYYELSSLWNNKIFLKYKSEYYFIVIPNAHIQFYFGYSTDSFDDKSLTIGELNFAYSLPKSVPGKNNISSEYKMVNKVIFKAKKREIFEKVTSVSPVMTLVKNNEKDQLIEYPDHQELTLWSYDNCKRLKGINILGLKLQFLNDKIIPIDIPIKNGFLFGDANNFYKIIYLDE